MLKEGNFGLTGPPATRLLVLGGLSTDGVGCGLHGPLGAYLIRHGIVPAPDGRLAFAGRQGSVMGRPGNVEVLVAVQAGGELAVSIIGDAATAFRAELSG